jgi:hypothetical protein
MLLFGSETTGGAVNVIDRRIPRGVPEHRVQLDAIGTYGSAADERSAGAGRCGAVLADRVTAQNCIAAFKTQTGDFTLVNGSVHRKPFGAERNDADPDRQQHLRCRGATSRLFHAGLGALGGRDFRVAARVSY